MKKEYLVDKQREERKALQADESAQTSGSEKKHGFGGN